MKLKIMACLHTEVNCTHSQWDLKNLTFFLSYCVWRRKCNLIVVFIHLQDFPPFPFLFTSNEAAPKPMKEGRKKIFIKKAKNVPCIYIAFKYCASLCYPASLFVSSGSKNNNTQTPEMEEATCERIIKKLDSLISQDPLL